MVKVCFIERSCFSCAGRVEYNAGEAIVQKVVKLHFVEISSSFPEFQEMG